MPKPWPGTGPATACAGCASAWGRAAAAWRPARARPAAGAWRRGSPAPWPSRWRTEADGYGTSMVRGLLAAAIAAFAVALAASDARACSGAACYVQAATLGEAPATGSSVLRFPQAIAYSPGASTILVADEYSAVVQRFDRTGAWLNELGGYADAGQVGRIGVVGTVVAGG